MIENVYNIFYPIMNEILQNQTDGEFICASTSKNVDAKAIFDGGKMFVLAGSRVTRDVANSYGNERKKEERKMILYEKAYERK